LERNVQRERCVTTVEGDIGDSIDDELLEPE